MSNESQSHPIYTTYKENMILTRKTQMGTQSNKIKQNKMPEKYGIHNHYTLQHGEYELPR